MSTIFRKIRKNQKTWIVVLGVICMLSFVFIPILLQNTGVRYGAGNQVAVKTSEFGKLTELQIVDLYRQRQVVGSFFNALGEVMRTKLSSENTDTNKMISIYGAFQRLMWYSNMILNNSNEEYLVENWLMMKNAQKMNIVISDQAINDFVNEMANNCMTDSDFATAKKIAGIRLDSLLVDAIRNILMANEYRRIYDLNFSDLSVAQQWENYLKTHQMISVNAYPVKVADFVKDVPEPTESELRTFFATYQEKEPNLHLGEVGFKQPKQVEIQYAVANLADHVKPETVTLNEMRVYYEEQKKTRYIKTPELNFQLPDANNPFSRPLPPIPTEGTTDGASFDPSLLEGLPGNLPVTEPATETAPAEITEPTTETAPVETT
ncbi:MAG: hypothetical protein Q4C96_04905, partial [Planctomycetia bacterium]|nr:hypothetical protein [Planctomycetia bacterium]